MTASSVRRRNIFAVVGLLIWGLSPLAARAQDPFGAAGPDNILSGYSSAYNQWTTALGGYGLRLFQLLAVIDFA